MATGPAPRSDHPTTEAPRAQPPIRWPRPDAATLRSVGVWVLGLIIALAVPALIVSPGAKSAPIGRVLTALAFTFIGAGVMLLASYGLWRRHRDPLVFVAGAVPAIACVAGGVIIAASKAFTF